MYRARRSPYPPLSLANGDRCKRHHQGAVIAAAAAGRGLLQCKRGPGAAGVFDRKVRLGDWPEVLANRGRVSGVRTIERPPNLAVAKHPGERSRVARASQCETVTELLSTGEKVIAHLSDARVGAWRRRRGKGAALSLETKRRVDEAA